MLPSERVYLLAALLGQLRVPRLELTALNLYVLQGLPQFRTWRFYHRPIVFIQLLLLLLV